MIGAALAGCANPIALAPSNTTESDDTRSPPSSPIAEAGEPGDVCDRQPTDIGISAINAPAFASDWTETSIADDNSSGKQLEETAPVVGINRSQFARAYPISILWSHEIVNDRIPVSGEPIVVTYCPLCRSGMIARRTISGETALFGVSGLLWQPPVDMIAESERNNRVFGADRTATQRAVDNSANLVMTDSVTGSYWSQMLARAICGPLRGTVLDIVASEVTTWGDWRRAHPSTDVLLPPPHSKKIPTPE